MASSGNMRLSVGSRSSGVKGWEVGGLNYCDGLLGQRVENHRSGEKNGNKEETQNITLIKI